MTNDRREGSASQIPSAFVAIYEELRDEVIWLHGRWLTYRQLFAVSPRRIELLNASAPTFFFFVQDVFLDNVQLSLSKLTDPAGSGKRENLTLEQLQSQLEKHGERSLATACRETLDKLQLQCKAIRVHRDKRVAHFDLRTKLKTPSDPLPAISRQMIEDALSSVQRYLNDIEMHYNNSQWAYRASNLDAGAAVLVDILRDGLRYDEMVQDGQISFDDRRKNIWRDA